MNFFYRLVRVAAFVLCIIVILYSAWLFVVGQPGFLVFENSDTGFVTYTPSPIAIVPFFASLLIFWGLVKKNSATSWIGAILLSVFSLLALFGVGSYFIVPALLLLASLVIFYLYEQQVP